MKDFLEKSSQKGQATPELGDSKAFRTLLSPKNFSPSKPQLGQKALKTAIWADGTTAPYPGLVNPFKPCRAIHHTTNTRGHKSIKVIS
jgi:hypothetical protein